MGVGESSGGKFVVTSYERGRGQSTIPTGHDEEREARRAGGSSRIAELKAGAERNSPWRRPVSAGFAVTVELHGSTVEGFAREPTARVYRNIGSRSTKIRQARSIEWDD